jgi:hypothetical protein
LLKGRSVLNNEGRTPEYLAEIRPYLVFSTVVGVMSMIALFGALALGVSAPIAWSVDVVLTGALLLLARFVRIRRHRMRVDQ